MNKCLILCGGTLSAETQADIKVVRLNVSGPQANVRLEIDDITRQMVSSIPDLLLDLLEIAAYVYAADQATSRGGDGTLHLGENWRRSFEFHIPVRNPRLWASQKVLDKLTAALSFVSDDDYNFIFPQLSSTHPKEEYFKFARNTAPAKLEEVVLFSGGLDSLAGAVDEIVTQNRSVALVSHRSNNKTFKPQKALVKGLRQFTKTPFLHIPILAHKGKHLNREYTQRSRSFLFASLGAVVARILDLWRIRFYENGVMSLNLPISEQIIGSRATRTTHPASLDAFSDLFGEIFGHEFKVENPFIWKTKTDVVKLISDAKCGDLISQSTSCTHTWDKTTLHSHCGICSQCVDRRFATLASGNESNDPEEMYATDLLKGALKPGKDITLVESYVRTAAAIKGMSEAEFFLKFQELNRVLPHLNGDFTKSARKVLELYRTHARQVCSVVDAGIKQYATEIREGTLPESCLIRLVLPDARKQPPKPELIDIPAEKIKLTPTLPSGMISLITTVPYCKVIERRKGAKPAEKTMTRDEYIRFLQDKNKFDMFVDGVTNKATRRTIKGRFLTEDLTPTEYEMLREYMETPSSIRPSNTGVGKALLSQTAATKLFESARRKADINTKRYEYRAFRTHKTVDPKMKSFEFAPPSDLGYCLVVHTPQ
jgi:7-cyano-7-deazaguanine synthase in queuosine biosynthesis